MKSFHDLLKRIQTEGVKKGDRTGTGTTSLAGAEFVHDMDAGFPLLTTKRVYHKAMRAELEGFLNGITDKRWYNERGCKIWNEWANPEKASYPQPGDSDREEKLKAMEREPDLGPVYGFQWRHFGARYIGPKSQKNDPKYAGEGVDQLHRLVEKIRENPNDRRMIVTAMNPSHTHMMALEPCHDSFQVLIDDERMHLIWRQRSIDTFLGLPFNIASYGVMLHLLSLEANSAGHKVRPGRLVGHLGDLHTYNNHTAQVEELLSRDPYDLPTVRTDNFTSIFNWTHTDTKFENYQHHPPIKADIAV